jgi:hypothetical protein
MMQKKDVVIGFLVGILGAALGVFLFVTLATDYAFIEGIMLLKSQNSLGKLIALGAVVNVIVFFSLLKFQKELIARGVVLATIALTLLTLFV